MNIDKELLIMYGKTLGLDADEMSEIAYDAAIAVRDSSDDSPTDPISAASGGCDPKTLWRGAVVYGYVMDTYTIGSTEDDETR